MTWSIEWTRKAEAPLGIKSELSGVPTIKGVLRCNAEAELSKTLLKLGGFAMAKIGCARGSTMGQNLNLQLDALTRAGCEHDDSLKNRAKGYSNALFENPPSLLSQRLGHFSGLLKAFKSTTSLKLN